MGFKWGNIERRCIQWRRRKGRSQRHRRIPPQTDHPAMPIKCARGDPKAITTHNSTKTQPNKVEICIQWSSRALWNLWSTWITSYTRSSTLSSRSSDFFLRLRFGGRIKASYASAINSRLKNLSLKSSHTLLQIRNLSALKSSYNHTILASKNTLYTLL